MIKIFFSYSHKDEELRNELDKHLSILKRQGVINAWHDRCITGGSELGNEISNHLKSSNIILLLISSDFLASDYCYDNEMTFAMSLHESGKGVVLPVILRPCDWQTTPFGKLLATPQDGKPVIKFPTLDEGFLEVTNEIKKIVSNILSSSASVLTKIQVSPLVESFIRSSNLRIKKVFSDHDKDKFLDDTFEYITRFFEGSVLELQKRNAGLTHRFKRIDSQTFTISVYIGGVVKSECTIFYGGDTVFGRSKGINFSYGINASKNSMNESLTVADDGFQLFLNLLGFSMPRQNNMKLTFEGAAEYYWELFIKRLQQ